MRTVCSKCGGLNDRARMGRRGQRYCRTCHNANMRANRLPPTEIERIRGLTRAKTRMAITRGLIIPESCLRCGRTAEAHHPDYTDHRRIVWLCPPHHRELHDLTRWPYPSWPAAWQAGEHLLRLGFSLRIQIYAEGGHWRVQSSQAARKPLPVYRQIADDLRARIVSGELTAGTPVPANLGAPYGVSTSVVYQALVLLRREGWLRKVKNRNVVGVSQDRRRMAARSARFVPLDQERISS